jgi:uncharacterized protein (DUF736 family)
MAYDNTNRGALFKNTKKRPDKKDPDYTGNMNVDGAEFWMDAWLEESKDGKKYMSVRVKPKDGAREASPREMNPDSEIPF